MMRNVLARCCFVFVVLVACEAVAAAPAPVGWEALERAPIAGATSVVAAGDDNSVQFVNSYPQAMRSTDGGATWHALPGETSTYNGLGQFAAYVAAGQPKSLYRVTHEYDSTVFVDHQFLWFSSDTGATWTPVGELKAPAGYWGFGTLAPIGPQPGLVIAELTAQRGGFTGYTIWPAALARSLDGGRTWAVIEATSESGLYGVGLTPSTYNRSAIYLADNAKGILRSTDSGSTWERFAVDATLDGLWVDARNGPLVYGRANGSFVASDDGGRTWRDVPLPDYTQNDSRFDSTALAVDPEQEGRIYALTRRAGLFVSNDAARSWQRLSVETAYDTFALVSPKVVRRNGKRSLLALGNPTVFARDLDAAPRAMALGTDLWWNPAEPGWGLSITQHDSLQMFVVWFTYDGAGKPTWRFIPGGQWVDANTFVGPLCSARTLPQNMLAQPNFLSGFLKPTVSVVGKATLTFTNGNAGRADFAFDGGPTITLPIQRMSFGVPAPPAPWPADLYFYSAEPGWGLGVHQQYRNYFVTWFLYDTNGEPTWLFMPDAVIPSFTRPIMGDVYRPASAPGAPYAARSVTVTKAGTATVGINGRGAMSQGLTSGMTYAIEGLVGNRLLEPMSF